MGDRDVTGENGGGRRTTLKQQQQRAETAARERGTNGRRRLPSAPASERASEREKGIRAM
jgi:hypothetical protein